MSCNRIAPTWSAVRPSLEATAHSSSLRSSSRHQKRNPSHTCGTGLVTLAGPESPGTGRTFGTGFQSHFRDYYIYFGVGGRDGWASEPHRARVPPREVRTVTPTARSWQATHALGVERPAEASNRSSSVTDGIGDARAQIGLMKEAFDLRADHPGGDRRCERGEGHRPSDGRPDIHPEQAPRRGAANTAAGLT
jgi:hypothetical protein